MADSELRREWGTVFAASIGVMAEDVESNDADVNREDGAGKQAHPGLAGFGLFCDM